MKLKCVVDIAGIGFTCGKQYDVQREILLLNKYQIVDDMGQVCRVNMDSDYFEIVEDESHG